MLKTQFSLKVDLSGFGNELFSFRLEYLSGREMLMTTSKFSYTAISLGVTNKIHVIFFFVRTDLNVMTFFPPSFTNC